MPKIDAMSNGIDRMRAVARRLGGWFRTSARGAAAVEFALVLPAVLAGITGVANYGLAMHEKMELEHAARAGAQMAIRDREDTSAIKQVVVDSTNLGITTADVTTTESCICEDGSSIVCGETCDSGDLSQYYMTVTASKTFTPLIVSENFTVMVLGKTLTLSGSARVRTK